jgi:hypothetical protein
MLFGHTVTPNDIQRGSNALQRSLQEWAWMGCHLTPYFHFSIHIAQQLLRTGPCYSSSVWAYKRNNGFLGRFNNNGHSGGEMEALCFGDGGKPSLFKMLYNLFCLTSRYHWCLSHRSHDLNLFPVR